MFSGPFSLAHPNNERNEQPQEASQIRNEGASNLLKAINNYSKDTNCNNEKNLTPHQEHSKTLTHTIGITSCIVLQCTRKAL